MLGANAPPSPGTAARGSIWSQPTSDLWLDACDMSHMTCDTRDMCYTPLLTFGRRRACVLRLPTNAAVCIRVPEQQRIAHLRLRVHVQLSEQRGAALLRVLQEHQPRQ